MTQDANTAAAALDAEAETHERHGRIAKAAALRRRARQMRDDPVHYAEEIAAAMPQTDDDATVRAAFPALVERFEAWKAASAALVTEYADAIERVERAFALVQQASQGPPSAAPGDTSPRDGGGDAVPAGPVLEPPAATGPGAADASVPPPPENATQGAGDDGPGQDGDAVARSNDPGPSEVTTPAEAGGDGADSQDVGPAVPESAPASLADQLSRSQQGPPAAADY